MTIRKEAWRASQNVGMDRGDAGGRPDGLDRPGPADSRLGRDAAGRVRHVGRGASASEPASMYGASSTRGARYLMRNGLDYLQYQQYERALKFLRDAEAKQKELTAPRAAGAQEGDRAAPRPACASGRGRGRPLCAERPVAAPQRDSPPARPEAGPPSPPGPARPTRRPASGRVSIVPLGRASARTPVRSPT